MIRLAALILLAFASFVQAAETTDWPQWGGSPGRNNVAQAKSLPIEWNAGEFDRRSGEWISKDASNVRWVARLGSECYSSPVVAGDRVYCGTNNRAGYFKRYPGTVDLACLLSFGRADGRFLWQYSSEKLKAGESVDWREVGLCCSPLVEGDRVWVVNNRGEVVCLDAEGFADNENDGPFASEPSGKDEADIVWSFDMMQQLGSVQRYQTSCSPTSAGDLLLVMTGNGRDMKDKLPAPKAPSFVALDKKTGKLVWSDASPGENILDGQWSSPAFAVLGGVPQAIFGGGDGWLYSLEAAPTADGKPKLLWKFDCNPKASVWEGHGSGDRNTIVAAPVIHDGRVYVVTGQDPESGEGQGDLWCIDPTKRGDVSAEIVVDSTGKPVSPRREQAVDADAGEQVKPNPNSAAVWHYRGSAPEGDDKPFEQTLHRSLGSPTIHDGFVVIGDFSGLIHCLDAKTGKAHWTHDTMSAIWGSPLVAEGRVYLGTQDGTVYVFDLASKYVERAKNDMREPVQGTIAAVGNTLYIATSSHLFAVGEGK